MDELAFQTGIPLPLSSSPAFLSAPLSFPAAAAAAARSDSARSAASPVSHKAAVGESGVGGVGVGASQTSLASAAALAGSHFDITRIDLSPSVDVLVAQQWESKDEVSEQAKCSDSVPAELSAASTLEPPALSPEPHIGSVLSSVQYQLAGEYELSGEPPHPCHPPRRSPPVDEQHHHHTQRIAPQYIAAEHQHGAHMAPRSRPSAYTYSQPIQQWTGQALLPATHQPINYQLQHNDAAPSLAYQPPHQYQRPAVYPPVHHPSMSYYHTTSHPSPAHSQPPASHLSSLHSFTHRHKQLTVQRDEAVRNYRQLEESRGVRTPQEHALLVQHLEHRYQQLQQEIESTEWMLNGNVPLATAADVPPMRNYAHEARVMQQQQQQQQQHSQQQQEDEGGEEEETCCEEEAAVSEAVLTKDSEGRQRKKSKVAGDRHPAGDEPSETIKTERKKKRKVKRKRNPDAPPHSRSAYIVSRAVQPQHTLTQTTLQFAGLSVMCVVFGCC